MHDERMRLQILSDLHLEFQPDLQLDLADDIDVLVAAGDICAGTEAGFAYLRGQAGPDLPIVAVAGNHEFYRRNWEVERAAAQVRAAAAGIDWLDDGRVEIGDVTFIGATLWTDYDVFGADKRDAAMRAAGLGMSDHVMISTGRDPERTFSPQLARTAHLTSRDFLERELVQSNPARTVVVTHHGPHPRSIAPKFRESIITAAFISDLSEMMEAHRPALWVHGHTHVNFDYRVGDTRVLCNPYGYPGENRRFIPRLIVGL